MMLENLRMKINTWCNKYVSLGGQPILINYLLNCISNFDPLFMKMLRLVRRKLVWIQWFFFLEWRRGGWGSGKLFHPRSMQIGSRATFLDGWELVFQILVDWIGRYSISSLGWVEGNEGLGREFVDVDFHLVGEVVYMGGRIITTTLGLFVGLILVYRGR